MAGIMQKLIAATGKSADEIMEALGRSKSSIDEIDMGDITSPTIKKGRPAKSPMIDPNEIDLGKASRKNIETGDIASDDVSLNDLDLGDAPAINPSIDDYRLPVANPNTARGMQGGGLPPAVISEADDMAGPLAVRGSTMPNEIPVQVMGKGTPTPKASGSVIDAELVAPNSKVSTMDAVREFAKNNKGKIAGGLTVAELARQMMSGGDEQPPVEIPMAPQGKSAEPESVLPDNYMKLAMDEANNQSPVSSKNKMSSSSSSSSTGDMSTNIEAGQDRSPAMQNEDDALERAQRLDSQNQLVNNLLRAGIMGGSAIAGSKADYSGVDALDKGLGQNVKNVKDKQSFAKEKQTMAKAQAELDDDNKLRDSNSDISKTARELAVKLGIKVADKVSAKQLQDAGLPLGTLLSTQIAADSRREMAQLTRESMSSSKDNSNKLKVQGSVDRQVSQLLKSKDYEAYNAAKDAEFALGGALETDDDKIKGGAAFMQYAKIAQGDNSVVRDGDMAQLAGRYNYTSVSDMFDKLKAVARGGNFGKNELAAMKEVAVLTQKIKGDRVARLLSPIMKRTDAAGLDITESLDPAVITEFGGKGSESKQLTTSSYTPAQERAIELVMSNNKVDRNKAIDALKKAKKL